MPKERIAGLITELHDTFGDDVTSEQQKALLAAMAENAHAIGENEHNVTMLETANLLLEEISEDHPQAASIVRQIIKLLGDIGV